MNTTESATAAKNRTAHVEAYRTKVAAMTSAELVEAHARRAAQAATLPMDHCLWQLSADFQAILSAELLRRLGA